MIATDQTRRVERTILRAHGIPNAHFRTIEGDLLCQASIWPEGTEDGRVQIVTGGLFAGMLNADQAADLAVALQLALEWVAEGLAERPSIEQMISDLRAAGWSSEGSLAWKSPAGALYRGPFGAWKAMKAWREG